MNVIGKLVNHKSFGIGTVTELTDRIITVSFYGNAKRFIYPDAFKNYLVFKSQKLQDYVETQIKEQEEVIQRKRKAEQEESERRQKRLNYKISVNSHLVFNIPSEQIDNVFQTLSVSTGSYLSGASKGLPRIADRVKPNSVCIFTSCSEGHREHERKLVGAFMVAEDFFGEEANDGLIKGHPKYYLVVPEGHQIPFWQQITQDIPPRWGNVAFKYCSAVMANCMLSKMIGAITENDQRDKARKFYQYFCEVNRLRLSMKQKTKNIKDAANKT
jgi:hypothetical protein